MKYARASELTILAVTIYEVTRVYETRGEEMELEMFPFQLSEEWIIYNEIEGLRVLLCAYRLFF